MTTHRLILETNDIDHAMEIASWANANCNTLLTSDVVDTTDVSYLHDYSVVLDFGDMADMIMCRMVW